MRLINKLAIVSLLFLLTLPVFGEEESDLNIKVDSLEKAIDNEANYIGEIEHKVSALQEEKRSLSSRVDTLNGALSERERSIKELEASKDKIAVADQAKTVVVGQALAQENEHLKKDLEDAGKKLSATSDALSAKEKELADLKDAQAKSLAQLQAGASTDDKLQAVFQELEAVKKEKDGINNILKDKYAEISTLKEKLSSAEAPKPDNTEKVKQELGVQLAAKEKEIADLKDTQAKFLAQLQAGANADEKLQVASKELEAVRKEKDSMNNLLKDKDVEVSDLKAKLSIVPSPKPDNSEKVKQELGVQLSAKDKELDRLQGNIDQLKKDLEAKAAQGKESGELAGQITALRQELSTATEERKKIEEELGSRDSQIEGLKDKLSHSQDPIKELKEKLREALNDKENLESQLRKDEKRLVRQDKEESSVQKLKADKRDLEKKIKVLDDQLDEAKDRVSALEKDLNKKEAAKFSESSEAKKMSGEIADKEKKIGELEETLAKKEAARPADNKEVKQLRDTICDREKKICELERKTYEKPASEKNEGKTDAKLLEELREREREVYTLKTVIKKAIERINALSSEPQAESVRR